MTSTQQLDWASTPFTETFITWCTFLCFINLHLTALYDISTQLYGQGLGHRKLS